MSDEDLKYDYQSTKSSENQVDDAQEIFHLEKQQIQKHQRLLTHQSPGQQQNHGQREFKSLIPIRIIPNSQINTPPNQDGISINSNIQQEIKLQNTSKGLNVSQINQDEGLLLDNDNEQLPLE